MTKRKLIVIPRIRPKCIAPGCDRLHNSHGYCQMHVQRMERNGHLILKRRPNGAGSITPGGYHIQGSSRKGVHVQVAEKALGKPLPEGAEVHHWNKNKLDNRPENLLICPNMAYHKLIHQRMDAMEACGHADWRRCRFCKKYDAPENMRVKVRNGAYHLSCAREHDLARRVAANARVAV